MRAAVVLVSVVAVAGLLYVLLSAWLASRARRQGPWRVDTVARRGNVLAVVLERDGAQHEHTVRELPAGMDAVELASELRLALEDARMQAEELNRSR
jgi:hypothetical protein